MMMSHRLPAGDGMRTIGAVRYPSGRRVRARLSLSRTCSSIVGDADLTHQFAPHCSTSRVTSCSRSVSP